MLWQRKASGARERDDLHRLLVHRIQRRHSGKHDRGRLCACTRATLSRSNWLDDEDAFQHMCRLMRDPGARILWASVFPNDRRKNVTPQRAFQDQSLTFGKGGQACMWLPIAPGLPLCTRFITWHQVRVAVCRVQGVAADRTLFDIQLRFFGPAEPTSGNFTSLFFFYLRVIIWLDQKLYVS